ncbi:GET complex subunit get1 [Rhizophlyctis rosea]|uniref:GET complex subunit get1 n=1 Tax=Rhizophlyctis rosea TaxID=64517 RepID=A0AAD5X6S0_9FUNG|nr:GET complex subunit get1 [Rhizophlyctis rosea]
MDPLLAVFLYALLLTLIDRLGYTVIGTGLYTIYQKAVNSEKTARFASYKQEITTLRRDLTGTSAQDEFAKWAKMRRRLDKLSVEYQSLAKELATSRSAFHLQFSLGMRALMFGAQILLLALYRSVAIFYLPHDWLGPFSRLLSLPSAPIGSVSVLVWYYACRHSLKRVITAVI